MQICIIFDIAISYLIMQQFMYENCKMYRGQSTRNTTENSNIVVITTTTTTITTTTTTTTYCS